MCQYRQEETAKYLLLGCSRLSATRSKLQDELQGSRLCLQLLLHTKIGIEKTLRFLKDTGIVTRKWHLRRRLEEGEVDEVEGDELDELVA